MPEPEKFGATILPSGIPRVFSLGELEGVQTSQRLTAIEAERAGRLACFYNVDPASAAVTVRRLEHQDAHAGEGLPQLDNVVFVRLPESDLGGTP